jgi:hypothetical protein
MGEVEEFFHNSAFDPETVKSLCDAYDKACRSLHDNGQPKIVSEVIALRIISLAKEGERDPDRLCAGALTALGNKAVFER